MTVALGVTEVDGVEMILAPCWTFELPGMMRFGAGKAALRCAVDDEVAVAVGPPVDGDEDAVD